ncbi:hypothetical protein JKP88DRAFT_247034 [Tribonema minus]|uniref:Uncharacterized protein n=1 Tax=Tribonema minus TaxID=303371 RepID=A0A835YT22_9STRA|nr:hypothetical protein JKP88DRAFT_247034 [Tribonema minus]
MARRLQLAPRLRGLLATAFDGPGVFELPAGRPRTVLSIASVLVSRADDPAVWDSNSVATLLLQAGFSTLATGPRATTKLSDKHMAQVICELAAVARAFKSQQAAGGTASSAELAATATQHSMHAAYNGNSSEGDNAALAACAAQVEEEPPMAMMPPRKTVLMRSAKLMDLIFATFTSGDPWPAGRRRCVLSVAEVLLSKSGHSLPWDAEQLASCLLRIGRDGLNHSVRADTGLDDRAMKRFLNKLVSSTTRDRQQAAVAPAGFGQAIDAAAARSTTRPLEATFPAAARHARTAADAELTPLAPVKKQRSTQQSARQQALSSAPGISHGTPQVEVGQGSAQASTAASTSPDFTVATSKALRANASTAAALADLAPVAPSTNQRRLQLAHVAPLPLDSQSYGALGVAQVERNPKAGFVDQTTAAAILEDALPAQTESEAVLATSSSASQHDVMPSSPALRASTPASPPAAAAAASQPLPPAKAAAATGSGDTPKLSHHDDRGSVTAAAVAHPISESPTPSLPAAGPSGGGNSPAPGAAVAAARVQRSAPAADIQAFKQQPSARHVRQAGELQDFLIDNVMGYAYAAESEADEVQVQLLLPSAALNEGAGRPRSATGGTAAAGAASAISNGDAAPAAATRTEERHSQQGSAAADAAAAASVASAISDSGGASPAVTASAASVAQAGHHNTSAAGMDSVRGRAARDAPPPASAKPAAGVNSGDSSATAGSLEVNHGTAVRVGALQGAVIAHSGHIATVAVSAAGAAAPAAARQAVAAGAANSGTGVRGGVMGG